MAGILSAGYVARPGEDIFPTTGPHLDVRVKKGGKYIDPTTWRSGLQNLVIGESKVPLFQQTKDGFKPSFPITSPFGPRSAPTAGASTFHRGVDFGVAGGTPLYWKGAGAFKPGTGLGTIQTPEGYEIELLHTKGGKAASLEGAPGMMQPAAPTIQAANTQGQIPSQQPINLVIDLVEDEPEQTITPDQMLKNYIVERFNTPKQTGFSPIQMAQRLLGTAPVNYFS
jgi:hypothetical protein